MQRDNPPHLGDLVVFSRDKTGKLKNIRVVKESAANITRGNIIYMTPSGDITASFLISNQNKEINIAFNHILGLSSSSLEVNEGLEAILYQGNVYGEKLTILFPIYLI